MISRRNFVKAVSGASVLGTVATVVPVRASPRAKFYLPEEADRHVRTFMQWPVNPRVHPDGTFLRLLQQSIATIANTISEFESVVMLMDAAHEGRARRSLGRSVDIWHVPTDDLWCRDSGPVFVVDAARKLAVSNLNFNGWGGKQPHSNDGKIAERVAARLHVPLLNNGLVGEAGGVETDGDGTLIAYASSWINANRNSGSKAEIEQQLLSAIGGEKVIWAPGVAGADITDYHIDSLARFIEPGHVLIQLPSKATREDPWSAAAFETYEILKASRDAKGRSFELTVIPEPEAPRIQTEDFVASYVNYYLCNGGVIAAEFGDPKTDWIAFEILSDLYPDREVVTLNVDPIGETGGGIHCATQQQPFV